jgi:hypothetical protein
MFDLPGTRFLIVAEVLMLLVCSRLECQIWFASRDGTRAIAVTSLVFTGTSGLSIDNGRNVIDDLDATTGSCPQNPINGVAFFLSQGIFVQKIG